MVLFGWLVVGGLVGLLFVCVRVCARQVQSWLVRSAQQAAEVTGLVGGVCFEA